MVRHLTAFVIACYAYALDTNADVYVFGLSKHSNSGYNETNTGLGAGFSVPVSDRIDILTMFGVYNDSYSNTVAIGGAGVRAMYGYREDAHAQCALIAGVANGSGQDGVVVVPVVGIGYGGFNVECAIDPTGDTKAVGFWFRYEWKVKYNDRY